MTSFIQSTFENAALAWLETIGWRVTHGLDTALDMHAAERRGHGEIALSKQRQGALLSKHISGELQVKDAEEFLGRAV